MREILFRGKRIDNGEWIEGYYVKYGYTGKEKDYIIPKYASDLYAVEVIPKTIGQYTGLTDKNCKKIFEGDIVKDVTVPVQCGIGIVKFGKYETRINFSLSHDNYAYHIGVYIKWNKTLNFYRNDLAFWNERIEVIGNIHDNPELLNTEGE